MHRPALDSETLDSNSIHRLIRAFGTPLYLYDLDVVDRRFDDLKKGLPHQSEVFFSLKANPLPAVAEALRRRGCRIEASSLGELGIAKSSGYPGSEILFSGPGKTEAEIVAALAAGVTSFSCESFSDLKRVGIAVSDSRSSIKVLVRLNPSHVARASLAMSGGDSQFGFETEELLSRRHEFAELLRPFSSVGIHVYYGTQIESVEALCANFEAAIQWAERLSDELELAVDVLDLGGGFPWPFATPGAPTNLEVLRDRVECLLTTRRRTAAAAIWFEAGRFLTASAGTLVARVVNVKVGKSGKKYVILDGGVNHLGGMAGLGRLMRPVVSLELLEGGESNSSETVDVVGPLCTPLDCLARNVSAPCLNPGDFVVIRNTGAYGLTASLVGFLSRTPPIEIACRNRIPIAAYRLRSGHEEIRL